MTLADIIILSIVVIVIGLIIYRMIKQRKGSFCDKCAYAKGCIDQCEPKKKKR